MKLSNNLTLQEVIKSNTAIRKGIKNVPLPHQVDNLKMIAVNVFQKCRDHFATAIGVSSGFRIEALNTVLGGSKTSDHIEGNALDMDAHIFGKITNAELFHYIKDNLEFSQLIWEYGTEDEPDWVHVSFVEGDNKKQVLKAVRGKGYINY